MFERRSRGDGVEAGARRRPSAVAPSSRRGHREDGASTRPDSARSPPLSLGFGRRAHAWRRCSWAMRSAISPSTSSRGLSPGWALIIAAMAPRRWSTKPCAALTSARSMNVRGVMAEMWQQVGASEAATMKIGHHQKVRGRRGIAARIRTDPDTLLPVPSCRKSESEPKTGQLPLPSAGPSSPSSPGSTSFRSRVDTSTDKKTL